MPNSSGEHIQHVAKQIRRGLIRRNVWAELRSQAALRVNRLGEMLKTIGHHFGYRGDCAGECGTAADETLEMLNLIARRIRALALRC